jgi:hypothetical protein
MPQPSSSDWNVIQVCFRMSKKAKMKVWIEEMKRRYWYDQDWWDRVDRGEICDFCGEPLIPRRCPSCD